MRTVVLIQARMGSTRLPGKMLLPLHGSPLLEWVIRRVAMARLVDAVVLATSVRPENDILARTAEVLGASVFRGDEDDVLGRFVQAAAVHQADEVIRVCADNPLVWGAEIDNLIRFFRNSPCDYAYNHIPRGNRYPDGIGAEMVARSTLDALDRLATAPAQREHVFNAVWENPGRFRIATFDPPDARLHRPDLRLDVDTAEDLAYLASLPLTMDMEPHRICSLTGESR